MPCILKIRVLAGRDLPVMDKASDLTDAYVEVRFADFDVQRTPVCRKTLNPVWHADFRFEVSDDADLQNEPLELKVLDYDAISANDAVGTVLVDLNPLLMGWESVSTVPGAETMAGTVSTAGISSAAMAAGGDLSADPSTTATPMNNATFAADLASPVLPAGVGGVAGNVATGERQISGWFPIYDTLRGIRGEINIQVKLQFFGDVNPFKESSAGVQVFSAGCLPSGYKVDQVFGFVEVLLTEDDPEYHWSDSFRTPRYSNEARQKLLYKMSGQLRRLLGKEVLEMGGNAVIGLRQNFDLEKEECMITARAIGTCVRLAVDNMGRGTTVVADGLERSGSIRSLSRLNVSNDSEQAEQHADKQDKHDEVVSDRPIPSASRISRDLEKMSATVHSPVLSTMTDPRKRLMGRRRELPHQKTMSSVSAIGEHIADLKGEILAEHEIESSDVVSMSGRMSNFGFGKQRARLTDYRQTLEPQLITLTEFPKNFIYSMSGIVSARSVKLLQSDETEVRESWWNELRDEIKSHAKTLGCSSVLGYAETATIRDELCILSAIGTAAVVDFDALDRDYVEVSATREVLEEEILEEGGAESAPVTATAEHPPVALSRVPKTLRRRRADCRCCHIPYSRANAPFPMNFIRCQQCKRRYVPEILLCNIEPPTELQTIGEGYYVEAHVCRPKKRKDGESNATIVGEILPFIEYDIHRQLLYKLRIQGLNAIFGLQIQLAIGESLIVAVASGTATFLAALPPPPPLMISRNLDVLDAEDRQFMDIQRRIMELSEENRRRIEAARIKLLQTDYSLTSVEQLDGTPGDTAVLSTGNIAEVSTVAQNASPGISESTTTPLNIPTPKPSVAAIATDIYGSSPSLHQQSSPRAGRTSLWARNQASGDHSDSDLSSVDSVAGDLPLSAAPMNVVVQVDDETDEDLMAVLLDPQFPEVFQICNTQRLPIQDTLTTPMALLSKLVGLDSNKASTIPVSTLESSGSKSMHRDGSTVLPSVDGENACVFNAQMITLLKEGTLSSTARHPNRQLAALFHELYEELQLSFSYFQSCLITGIAYQIDLPKDNTIQIRLNATVIGQHRLPAPMSMQPATGTDEPTVFTFDPSSAKNVTKVSQTSLQESLQRMETFKNPSLSPLSSTEYHLFNSGVLASKFVEITPLARVPGHQIVKHLGRLSLHFVKEDLHLHHAASDYAYYFFTDPNMAEDGLGRFMYRFLSEVQAIARAHTIAMGGNSLIGFRLEQSVLRESLKNQAYGMLSISGDVVQVRPVPELRGQLVTGEQLVQHLWRECLER